jgi:hypothetical protein
MEAIFSGGSMGFQGLRRTRQKLDMAAMQKRKSMFLQLVEPDFQRVTHEVERERIDVDEQEGLATVLLHTEELMKCGEIWMLKMSLRSRMGMAIDWDKEGFGCVGFGNVAGCLRFQQVHFVIGELVKDEDERMGSGDG